MAIFPWSRQTVRRTKVALFCALGPRFNNRQDCPDLYGRDHVTLHGTPASRLGHTRRPQDDDTAWRRISLRDFPPSPPRVVAPAQSPPNLQATQAKATLRHPPRSHKDKERRWTDRTPRLYQQGHVSQIRICCLPTPKLRRQSQARRSLPAPRFALQGEPRDCPCPHQLLTSRSPPGPSRPCSRAWR